LMVLSLNGKKIVKHSMEPELLSISHKEILKLSPN
jgi:hypothetical protein